MWGAGSWARRYLRGLRGLRGARNLRIALAGPALAAVAVHPGCAPRPREALPPIVLITVDTLRADHLGCYGYDRPTSPHIDRFAGEALRFERAFAHASETRTSLGSLLSGFLPHETQVAIEGRPLVAEIETLAEKLRERGYGTAAVVSNYVLRRAEGWDQGFDLFDDTMTGHELNRDWPERTAEPTTDRAIELWERRGDKPLFLWVHYQDPHGPYAPPGRFEEALSDDDGRPEPLAVNDSLSGYGGIPAYQVLGDHRDRHYYVDRYDGEIRYHDEQVGRLLDAIGASEPQALIVYTSDHGEELGEHGFYFSHGETLYSSLTHVPLIVRVPDMQGGPRRDLVQHLDLLPTLAARVGLAADPRWRGRDLFDEEASAAAIFAESRSAIAPEGPKFSLIQNGLKLIVTAEPPRYELYDLIGDPAESDDLALEPSYQARIASMLDRIDHLQRDDRLDLPDSFSVEPLGEEQREKLRSLGYLRP